MKKIICTLMFIYIVIFGCICPFISLGDELYFWINNEDLRYTDQTSTTNPENDSELFAYISWEDNGETKSDKLTITKATVTEKSGGNPWGQNPGKPGGETTRDMTVQDLEHTEPVRGKTTVVYKIDLGSYTINKNADPVYNFMLELDYLNGTDYYSTFTEQEVWQSGRWSWSNLEDHICSGLDFIPGQAPIPEPNSSLLMLIGFGFLCLKRKFKA